MTVGVVMAAPLFLQWWLSSTLNYRKWDGRRATHSGRLQARIPQVPAFPHLQAVCGQRGNNWG
jgi:hypothetical protein